MPTYLYECKLHGEFEAVHSVTEELKDCPQCKEGKIFSEKPKRLIASGGTFVLVGSGWAKDRYS